ncbi:rhodanese-related sulfurtransferase [Algoriphagus boseongensis]|uniref:Rhodanese-related sulfurtransferase n=1 Tax=Algoriphagus boseongensis TaxID=1442587 RepID=A0A4R6T5J3_9BACT|nr:rhodanese-related sulfurtransferase [Algoriphagus boseongensis]
MPNEEQGLGKFGFGLVKDLLQKQLLVIFLIALETGFFVSQAQAQSPAYKTLLSTLYDESFPVVKPNQIKDLSNYQILDTREKPEFEVSHLSGSQWVGYDTFSLESIKNLDKNKPVLVYCTVGARSEAIGKKLKEAGFTRVYNLYGGIINWVNEGQEVECKGLPTQKVHTYSQAWGIWLEKGEKVYE